VVVTTTYRAAINHAAKTAVAVPAQTARR